MQLRSEADLYEPLWLFMILTKHECFREGKIVFEFTTRAVVPRFDQVFGDDPEDQRSELMMESVERKSMKSSPAEVEVLIQVLTRLTEDGPDEFPSRVVIPGRQANLTARVR